MATIQPALGTLPGNNDRDQVYVQWGPVTTADTCAPLTASFAVYGDRSFQVEGTFGAGGTVLVQGSNDIIFSGSGANGINWRTLTDPFGVALSITTASLHQLTEAVAQIKPVITGGDVTTSLYITATLRRGLR